jgi:UDP-N-acetylmuramoyl-L-alanyl-D-glutamate--2,6-diaminopimelate ligase
LLGEYNKDNVLTGVAVAQALGVKIENDLSYIKPLPGRLEFIENNLGIQILIDYAFEPKALEKLYETIKDIPHGKIIHVLGSAGGGRDKARRPIMGHIAAENADIIIITNEDPYEEDPLEIIEQVAQGATDAIVKNSSLENSKFSPYGRSPEGRQISNSNKLIYTILDRREAIHKALELALPVETRFIASKNISVETRPALSQSNPPLVLITGKGAEQAICVENGQKIPWDDRQVAREELEFFSK